MKKPLLAALAAITLLTGCASVRESRVNPFNWFQRSEPEKDLAPELADLDRRGLVDQVVSMKVDAVPGGALVTAIGLPPTQGYWDTELVTDENTDQAGVLVLQFRAEQPTFVSPQGAPVSREVSAGLFVSDQTLEGIRQIIVLGAQNQRSSRR